MEKLNSVYADFKWLNLYFKLIIKIDTYQISFCRDSLNIFVNKFLESYYLDIDVAKEFLMLISLFGVIFRY